jgi:mercuric ion transport protein
MSVTKKNLTLGGALVGALVASSCCIGPLVVAALGIGGAGAFAAISSARPYALGVTVALLVGGFYLSYRRPKHEDACGCEPEGGKGRRAGRIGLWTATALVVVLAVAPNLLAAWAHRRAPSPAPPTISSAPASPKVEHATIIVKGIDCEACAVSIRASLAKVGGLRDLTLDLPGKRIEITYEPAPGRVAAYVAAINELGFEASLP